MIVRKNKSYEVNSLFPNSNWYENEPDNIVIDETTEEGRILAQKIIRYAPYFEFVYDTNGNIVDITPIEKPFDLEAYKQQKITELNKTCNSTILAGFQSNALGSPHTYDFDYEAQINIGFKWSRIKDLPETDAVFPIIWNTKDAGLQPHTKAQFEQVVHDGEVHKESNWYKYFQLVEQVKQASTKEQVDAIVW